MDLISTSWRPSVTDREAVGGKADSLFRMIEIGATVPPFFVLTTRAFRESGDGRVGDDLRSRITATLTEVGADHRFAVRSSATAEDSADDSFAGVFDTFLDLLGPDAVCEAIEKCWESFSGARAMSYRRDRHVEKDDAMAVIVQHMVPAEWAGVAFTADPVTLALSNTVVNAVPGVGEALVSGVVNPEQIRLDSDGRILERLRPPEMPPLPDPVLIDVVEKSRDIAKAVGFPQDLEWAYANKTLYFLQTRPITTLAGVAHNRSLEAAPDAYLDSPTVCWTRAFADEVWSPPVSPLFYDIQNLSAHLVVRLGYEGISKGLPENVFKYYKAAPYADTSVLARLYCNLPPVARRPGLLSQLPEKEQAAVRAAPFKLAPLLKRLWIFEVKRRQRWSIVHNHRFLESSWAEFVETAEDLSQIDLGDLSDHDVDRHLEQVWKLALMVGVECEVAVLYHAYDLKLLMSGLLDRWLGHGDETFAAISSGLPNSQTVRESDELWSIAEKIRELDSGQRDTLMRTRLGDLLETENPQAVDIRHAVRDFLGRHRHRGANYKDLIYPRWGDDPEQLWQQIKAFVETPGVRPRDANHAAAIRRVDSQANALRSLEGWRALYRKPLLRLLFRYNEIYSGIRDNHRFYYDYVWWVLRRVYVEKGKRLTAAGLLERSESAFFLSRQEIADLALHALSKDEAAERISVRRKEWEETRKSLPPKFLHAGYLPLSDGEVSTSGNMLRGIPASSGKVTGKARIAYDIGDLSRLRADEILVTRQTDPAWTPAFARIAGLVLETGGTLAHGASLCREFGLPCVTAVEGATALIRDGDLVSVRGGDGIVEIVERCQPSNGKGP